MINFILVFLMRTALWLRYRIKVSGLEEVAQAGRYGILFLPNHPALIDPVILVTRLYGRFRVRVLADETQIDRPVIRFLARRINVLPIPDLGRSGTQSAEQVRAAMDRCVAALSQGDNLVLYPAGHINRRHSEQIGANSAVERILRDLPDVRIVLVRTRGLWGSSTSWASGRVPLIKALLLRAFKLVFLNGIFFTPRRPVEIDLSEADDLPRQADRRDLNAYLQSYLNGADRPNTYVPYTFWEGGGVRVLPEPRRSASTERQREMSPAIRSQVLAFLREATGVTALEDSMSLSADLNMDSLAQVDLIAWLEREYGHVDIDVDALMTISDVLWAACGEAVSIADRAVEEIANAWFHTPTPPARPEGLNASTVTEAFLYQAQRRPGRAIVADSVSGVKTYRDMVLAILLLRKHFVSLPGSVLGIMLPASVGVSIVYLATLFAGKIPVMVNWTLGRRNLLHALDALEVQHIVTANALLARIRGQGTSLEAIEDRFLAVEDMRGQMSPWDKLWALGQAYFNWSVLRQVTVPDTAAVLFTSGSESVPKAVPLSHRNVMTNVSDINECLTMHGSDSFLGILPPFHSFGLTGSMILPLTLGIRVVYYPNPTHGSMLANIVEAYRLTLLIGTPTFLDGILRTARPQQLASLRIVVTGAEKCPQRVFDLIAQVCPQTVILEGYGITECSPCVSINHETDPRPGTIGRIMASLEHAIVGVDSGERVPIGQEGVLLVRGDSVFSGYHQYQGPSPFVECEGKQWYRTGDLVVEDEEGVLTFSGRLKRFIKLGGEMISLPAVETVLQQHFAHLNEEGPLLAVVATPVEQNPDIVLFTTAAIERESANQAIRAAGLSGLHNVRKVMEIDKLPQLGTGKLDYKAMEERLR